MKRIINKGLSLSRKVNCVDLDEAIKGRRSIRSYLTDPVPEELIREVLEAATYAPSAKNGQQWRFTVLTGNAKKELTDIFRQELRFLCREIGAENMGSSFGSCNIMEEAPVVIVVWNAGEEGWETEVHSVAAAIQNMLLKAYGLGLGSLWIGDIFFVPEAFIRHFETPWKLMAAVTLGWPNHDPSPLPRKSVDQVTEFLG
ncbi:MAG: nitroreductase family protein [Theionarchaea archaeon]|nr:nitroreductase family protein [Theionarchaea archaeon]